MELGGRAVAHEEREQRIALGPLELLESGGETLVDVERGTAGLGMGAHRGVLGQRIGAVPQVLPAVAADVVLPAPRAPPSARRAAAACGRTGPPRRRTCWRTACRRPTAAPARPAGMLPNGGSTSHETSECHSSPDTNFESPSACTTRISGCSASFGAAGWTCRSPKRRPKALCCGQVSSWSRKKSTRWVIRAARIAATASGASGWLRSTPDTSAPMTGDTGSTRM